MHVRACVGACECVSMSVGVCVRAWVLLLLLFFSVLLC